MDSAITTYQNRYPSFASIVFIFLSVSCFSWV